MEKRIRYVLIVLAGILAVLLIFLFFQYRSLQQQQLIGSRDLRAALFLQRHGPLPVSDAAAVRSWMTFDYVNRLFALPPDYLSGKLGVAASSSYPRITISNYAKATEASSTVLLNEIENAVRAFSSSTATSSAARQPAAATSSSSAAPPSSRA